MLPQEPIKTGCQAYTRDNGLIVVDPIDIYPFTLYQTFPKNKYSFLLMLSFMRAFILLKNERSDL